MIPSTVDSARTGFAHGGSISEQGTLRRRACVPEQYPPVSRRRVLESHVLSFRNIRHDRKIPEGGRFALLNPADGERDEGVGRRTE
jgi:hypothetical protein